MVFSRVLSFKLVGLEFLKSHCRIHINENLGDEEMKEVYCKISEI